MASIKGAPGLGFETPEWLEVVKLSHTDWRISDRRVQASDSGRLLGYVEKLIPGRFEVLWITDPPRWAYTDSLEIAVHAFVEGARFTGPIQAERDIALIRPATRAPYRVRRRASPIPPSDTYVA